MESQEVDLKKTVNLPRTDFPMKANLPQNEPKMLERWEQADIYGQIRSARAGRPKYVLHDGPPYANGNIHLGHAFNKIAEGLHRQIEDHGRLRFALRARLGLPRPADRNQGR